MAVNIKLKTNKIDPKEKKQRLKIIRKVNIFISEIKAAQ